MTYKKLSCLMLLWINFSCLAQEVSEEMLISGKWLCHEIVNKYANYDKNEHKRMYFYNEPIDNVEINYTKKNGVLIQKTYLYEKYGNDKNLIFEGPYIQTSGTIPNKRLDEPVSTVEYKEKYIFISKDKFKKVSDSIERYQKSKKLSSVRYYEIECTKKVD